jgi:hypothetical protein
LKEELSIVKDKNRFSRATKKIQDNASQTTAIEKEGINQRT